MLSQSCPIFSFDPHSSKRHVHLHKEPTSSHTFEPSCAFELAENSSVFNVAADLQSHERLDDAKKQIQWLQDRLNAAEADSASLRQQLQGSHPFPKSPDKRAQNSSPHETMPATSLPLCRTYNDGPPPQATCDRPQLPAPYPARHAGNVQKLLYASGDVQKLVDALGSRLDQGLPAAGPTPAAGPPAPAAETAPAVPRPVGAGIDPAEYGTKLFSGAVADKANRPP
jgi:hypothetical protein